MESMGIVLYLFVTCILCLLPALTYECPHCKSRKTISLFGRRWCLHCGKKFLRVGYGIEEKPGVKNPIWKGV